MIIFAIVGSFVTYLLIGLIITIVFNVDPSSDPDTHNGILFLWPLVIIYAIVNNIFEFIMKRVNTRWFSYTFIWRKISNFFREV